MQKRQSVVELISDKINLNLKVYKRRRTLYDNTRLNAGRIRNNINSDSLCDRSKTPKGNLTELEGGRPRLQLETPTLPTGRDMRSSKLWELVADRDGQGYLTILPGDK